MRSWNDERLFCPTWNGMMNFLIGAQRIPDSAERVSGKKFSLATWKSGPYLNRRKCLSFNVDSKLCSWLFGSVAKKRFTRSQRYDVDEALTSGWALKYLIRVSKPVFPESILVEIINVRSKICPSFWGRGLWYRPWNSILACFSYLYSCRTLNHPTGTLNTLQFYIFPCLNLMGGFERAEP
jgi:hypothetical protein